MHRARILWAFPGLVGLVVLAAATLLLTDWTSLEEALLHTEHEVKVALVRGTRAPASDAVAELAALRRLTRREASRLQRRVDSARPEVTPETLQRAAVVQDELERLHGKAAEWEERMRGVPDMVRGELWVEVVVGLFDERTRWPLGGVITRTVDRPRVRHRVREVGDGVVFGAFWPVFATYRAARPSPFGFVRKMFYPYGPAVVFHLPYLLAFALAGIGVGYGLCGIGVRFRWGWASYLGLLYFLYVVLFFALYLTMQWGMWE